MLDWRFPKMRKCDIIKMYWLVLNFYAKNIWYEFSSQWIQSKCCIDCMIMVMIDFVTSKNQYEAIGRNFMKNRVNIVIRTWMIKKFNWIWMTLLMNNYRTTSLLGAGIGLAHQTVRCSALNAEELRREGGLEALLEAISRCIPMIGLSSKPDDVPVQVHYLCFNLVCY